MIAKRIASFVLLMVLFLITPAQGQGDLSVTLETTTAAPELRPIRPDKTFVHTILTVVDSNNQPVPNAFLKLHLKAPASNPILSTDFPIVEGTTLLRYEGMLPNGRFEFDYIYPIRGLYNFHVEAGRDPATLSFKNTLSLDLSENFNEVINLVILLAVLLALGIIAGVVIGNGARAQRLATAGLVLMIVGVGFMGRLPAVAQAQHGGHEVMDAKPFTESVTNEELTLTYSMNPGVGKVGTLNSLNFTSTDNSGVPVPNTSFAVRFWHIEDEKPVFATNLYAPTGQTQIDFQFFDGAEHEVKLQASSTVGTIDLIKVIEVQPVDPPLLAKLKTTIYLVLVTFVGILIGLHFPFSRGKSGVKHSPLNTQRSTP